MMSPATPMTISLEEHVARAIWIDESPDRPWDKVSSLAHRDYLSLARAAIAAVREREGAGSRCPHCEKEFPKCGCWSDVPNPAEAMRAKCEELQAQRDEAIRQSQGYLKAARDCLDQNEALRGGLTEAESILSTLALSSIRRALVVISAALKGNGEGR